MLPTPSATDWKGSSRPGQRRGQLSEVETMLPMPNAWDGERGPDYAKASREGSGADDLTTRLARLSRGEPTNPLSTDGSAS